MIKIGKISYTNIYPIYYFFDELKFADQVTFIPQIPSELNQRMKRGEIDLGPISSFAYAENAASYILLPDLSISCKGKVRSIYLFSKLPIEKLEGRSVALTSSSATSVALLKILLQHFYQCRVSYETMQPSIDEMLKEHDAALLIGDDALHAKWQNTNISYIYDLGELWYHFTQRHMTFAVWAVRREVVKERAMLLEEISAEFQRSKQKGLHNLGMITGELSRSFGGSLSFWETYYQGLSYDLSGEQQESLEYFYRLAFELGLLKEATQVEVWVPEKKSIPQ